MPLHSRLHNLNSISQLVPLTRSQKPNLTLAPVPGYNTTTGAECSGHGTCHADLTQATNPSCSCANHWTGSECSECTLGYTGADCNQCAAGFVSVNGSCTACPGYCSSGQGTCQAVNGAATCQCGTGWTGSECSRPDTANGYFLVYDGNGDLVNGTVSSSPQRELLLCQLACLLSFLLS